MSLSRKEQVAICQTCVKRHFDKSRGVLCSLTNEYADFDVSCPTYEADSEAIKRSDRLNSTDTHSTGKKSAEAKALIVFGILLIVAGIVIMFFYMSIGRFPIIAIGPIIAGIGLCARAGKTKPVAQNKAVVPDETDDGDLEVL